MAEQDTAVRRGGSQFPPTAWSLLHRLRDPKDPRVRQYLEKMIELYWRPIYKFIRLGWKRSNEDAKDLTQAFFVRLIEGSLLEKADPERGNFRKLLLVSLRHFLANDARSGKALKRGGEFKIFSLDTEALDRASDAEDPSDAFEGQWARDLLSRAVDKLQKSVRPEVFLAFRRFHFEGAAVKDIVRELKATEPQVGHFLQDARTALRRFVTDEIKEYVTDDAELARELDSLFGAWR